MLPVPAELELRKAVVALLVMLALPAELELVNWSSQLLVMLALPPVMLIPAPVHVMPPPLLIVKLYADVPVKSQAPTVAKSDCWHWWRRWRCRWASSPASNSPPCCNCCRPCRQPRWHPGRLPTVPPRTTSRAPIAPLAEL